MYKTTKIAYALAHEIQNFSKSDLNKNEACSTKVVNISIKVNLAYVLENSSFAYILPISNFLTT